MYCGHPPSAIDEYSYADVKTFLMALPVIWHNQIAPPHLSDDD